MITIAAGDAGQCRRAIHYALEGFERSEPLTPESQNMIGVAIYTQQAAVDGLRRDGWQVRNAWDLRTAVISEEVRLTLRPPYVVAHPEVTEDREVLATITATSERGFDLYREFGPLVSHPRNFDHLAFAVEQVGEFPDSGIDLEQPQFMFFLNRNTGFIEYEPVLCKDLAERREMLALRLVEYAALRKAGETPYAEYRRESRTCQRCPWLTLCHGPVNENDAESVTVSEEQLNDAFLRYAEASANLEGYAPWEKQRKEAMAIIKKYILENDAKPVSHQQGTDQWDARVSISEKPAFSSKLARERLSATQLESVTGIARTETIRINKVKSE